MKAKKTGATAAPPGPDVNYYNEADDTGKADTNMEPGFVGSNYEALQETPATQNKTEGMLSKLKQRISLSLLLLWFLSVMLSIGISYAIVWSTIPQHTIKQLKQENRIPSDTLAGYALKLIHKTNLSCDGTTAAGMAPTGNQIIVVCKNSNVTNIYDLETLNYTGSAIVPGLHVYGQEKISIISIQQSVYICGYSRTYINSTSGWRYGYKIWKSVLTLNSTHGEFVRWEVWRELNFSALGISPTLDGGIMVVNSANLTFLDSKTKIVKIVPISVSSSARYRIYGSFLQQNGNYVLHSGFPPSGAFYDSRHTSVAFMTLSSDGVSQKINYIDMYRGGDYYDGYSSKVAVGPDDYVFHASCGPLPEISIMDWNVTSVKLLANYKTHDLKCDITAMSYHHDSGRLIISEALDSFWAGAFTVSPNSLKIFQVIQPERRK